MNCSLREKLAENLHVVLDQIKFSGFIGFIAVVLKLLILLHHFFCEV